MFALVLVACSSAGGFSSTDLAAPDFASMDLAQPQLTCRADTCPVDQYCVEECRGPQHCIPAPPRCQPIGAAITSCSCLDSDPCRASNPCFDVWIRDRKVRCTCE